MGKTPTLVHYFLVNLECFPTILSSFDKVPLMALYSKKNKGLRQLPNNVEFILNQVLKHKTFLSKFLEPYHAYTCPYMRVHAVNMRMHSFNVRVHS